MKSQLLVSAGEMFDDTVITTKVKAAFVQDKEVSALHINVTCNKGIVQLGGTVSSAQEMVRAEHLASTMKGVKGVENNIHIK